MDVISNFAARYERTREEEYSLEEYLEICKGPHERFPMVDYHYAGTTCGAGESTQSWRPRLKPA